MATKRTYPGCGSRGSASYKLPSNWKIHFAIRFVETSAPALSLIFINEFLLFFSLPVAHSGHSPPEHDTRASYAVRPSRRCQRINVVGRPVRGTSPVSFHGLPEVISLLHLFFFFLIFEQNEKRVSYPNRKSTFF